MVRERQQRGSALYALDDFRDKLIGLGCMAASAGVSFGMMVWLVKLLGDNGLPF